MFNVTRLRVQCPNRAERLIYRGKLPLASRKVQSVRFFADQILWGRYFPTIGVSLRREQYGKRENGSWAVDAAGKERKAFTLSGDVQGREGREEFCLPEL